LAGDAIAEGELPPVIGVQAGWTAASTVGSTVWSPEYGVSGPRSWRLSMMLLRARLAVTEAYVGQLRAARRDLVDGAAAADDREALSPKSPRTRATAASTAP